MKNFQINSSFLANTDVSTKSAILANIAQHYSITAN